MADDPNDRSERGELGSDAQVREAVSFGQALTRLRRAPWVRLIDVPLLDGTEEPLEQGEVDTLDAIARNRDAPMSHIADRMQITRSTASRAVERLEKRGLAERYRLEDSRRTVRVRLTRRGTKAFWELSNRRVGFMVDLLEALEPEEREALTSVLPKLTELTIAGLSTIPVPEPAGHNGDT